MTRACHVAVRAATGDVFSDEEIDDFLDRLAAQARRARKEAPSLTDREAIAEAARALTREALREAFIARRTAIAAKLAKKVRGAKLEAMPPEMAPAKRLEAINVGSERQGLGTSASIDAEGRARQMDLWGDVKTGLEQVPGLKDRLSNFFGVGERRFDRLVAQEMARLTGAPGVEPTGDEGALHAARVFVAALKRAREMQNGVGAWIDELPGYVARQSHDAGKIAGGFWRELGELGGRVAQNGIKDLDWAAARSAAEARAFGQWRDFIRPKLDPKTFDGLEAMDAEDQATAKGLAARGIVKDPADPAELMLHRIWMDIVTGRHAELTGASDLGDFRPRGSLARSVSKARVLHFAGPDAWADYAQKYGRTGGLYAAVMDQLERAGRNTALMRVWGPAPEAAFDAEVSRLRDEARSRGAAGEAKALDSPMVRARFEAVNGMAEAPANLRFAQVMRGLRGWEALTKLGSIVLSKTTDIPITAGVFKRVGGDWLGGYRAGVFDGLLNMAPAEQKAAAEALDVGARAFAGHMAGQFLSSDGPAGWTAWATRLMYRVNGFQALNEAIRKGAAGAYSALLGGASDKAWGKLPKGMAETFERFGISPADWDAARGGLEAASDGRKYFGLDHVADEAVRWKFAVMIHNVIDDVVSEPRARERSGMTRGSKAGTRMGELDRAFFQFKGFVNTIVGRHLVPAARGYAGVSPVFLLGHLLLGTALAGYVSMNAKRIARGEVPKGPLGDDLGGTLGTWGAALTQGGGLGLYGDFLLGELNRSGHDFDWGELGGPLLSDSETAAKVVRQAISGGAVNESTGRSQIPGELVKLGAQNIPLVNLWYTRLAIDYLVLWRLQEAVSPGYLQRYESRVQNQEHSQFLVNPTSALP
jgi:hypothetical protein